LLMTSGTIFRVIGATAILGGYLLDIAFSQE
jgi:hypothetical protein